MQDRVVLQRCVITCILTVECSGVAAQAARDGALPDGMVTINNVQVPLSSLLSVSLL
jgi:hypothetical protein